MPATPAPMPSFIRKSRRLLTDELSVTGPPVVATAGPSLRDLELLHRHRVRGAADGTEAAADAAVVVLHHRGQGQAVRLGPRLELRLFLRSEVERLERDDGQAELGTHVDAAAAQHALLGVVDRLDVADEAARGLAPGRVAVVARLDFRDTRAPAEVERRRGLAVEHLEARLHPVLPGRDLRDLERPLEPRAFRREELVDRAGRALAVRHRLDQVAGTEGHVPAREDPGRGRRERRGIDLDRAARRELDAVLGTQERELRLLADREDAGVGVDRDHVLVVVLGGEAAARVEDRAHAAELDRLQAGAAQEALRPAPGQERHAFALRLLELLVALRRAQDRHLVEPFEGDDGDLGRAAPYRRPRGVERLLHPRLRLGGEGVEV